MKIKTPDNLNFRMIINKAYQEESKEIGKEKLMERINVRVHLHNFRVKLLKSLDKDYAKESFSAQEVKE